MSPNSAAAVKARSNSRVQREEASGASGSFADVTL